MSSDIERWDPPNDATAFESLCLDLWRDLWQADAQKNGRSGQPQAGVDIYGLHNDKWVGVQCKQKDGLIRRWLTAVELDEEVEAAKGFKPPLSAFILATTGPRDAKLQAHARELTERHLGCGLFSVEVWSWADIWSQLYSRESLLQRIASQYWPRLSSIARSKETVIRSKPSSTGSKEAPLSPDLKEAMERARAARRRHDLPIACELWEEVHKLADVSNNRKMSILARLEKARLQLEDDFESDAALQLIEGCLSESNSIDRGDELPRILQLLGEIHRLNGNDDQARGLLNNAIECARSQADRCDEGWALLALSIVGHKRGFTSDLNSRFEQIEQAYRCFSAVYTSGSDDDKRLANDGFATCHSLRAEILDYGRRDEALVEYGRALEIYSGMGKDAEWKVADTLYRRGDLLTRVDDPVLASKDLNAAADLFEKLGDHVMRANCVLAMADLLDGVGKRSDSVEYFRAATQIAMKQSNPKKIAWFLYRYAAKLGEQRDFDQQKSILKALLDADWLRSGQRLDVLKMLRLGAQVTGQDEEAHRYSKEIIEILDEEINGAKSADMRRHLNLSKGHALEELERDDQALASYRRSLEAFENAADREGMVEAWWCIAHLMQKQGETKEEREAYEKILSLAKDKHKSFYLPMALAMLAQLDIKEDRFEEAQRNLDRAAELGAGNPMVVMLTAELRSTLPQLFQQPLSDQRGQSGPAKTDLPSLVRELRDWCAWQPTLQEAILPVWFYIHRAELSAILRSMLGVKFLIYSPDVATFGELQNILRKQGDLFIWGTNFGSTTEHTPEAIPVPKGFLYPAGTTVVSMAPKESSASRKDSKRSKSSEQRILKPRKGIGNALYALAFLADMEGFPKGSPFFVGSKRRLDPKIAKFMLKQQTKIPINDPCICFPLTEEDSVPKLKRVVQVGWEYGAIPVFSGSLPHGEEIRGLCDTVIEFPSLDEARLTIAKELWVELLASCIRNPKSSLALFSKEMAKLRDDAVCQFRSSARVYLLAFEADGQQRVQPALVLNK